LGYGKKGQMVIEGTHKRTNIQVAIKIMSKKVMKQKDIENVRDIFKIWQTSLHHNIVRFDDYFES
jgi:serine/threonine protein kinase